VDGFVIAAGAAGTMDTCKKKAAAKAEFAVAHTIVLKGISATEFMADPKIIASFQDSVATTLKVDSSQIINIKAKSSRRQLLSRKLEGDSACRYESLFSPYFVAYNFIITVCGRVWCVM
jgi:hypothetical protein